jgi:chondroitin AC lyase
MGNPAPLNWIFNNHRLFVIALALTCITTMIATSFGASDEISTIKQNLCEMLLDTRPSGKSSDTAVHAPEARLAEMRPDGSWPDQDYADRDRLHWKAGEHLPRLLAITRAYYSPAGRLSKKSDVLNRIDTSLRFWLTKDPKNDNWWHNEIGVPQQIGQILILLGNDTTADLRGAGIELMKRAKWTKQTGANLTDETIIQVMRGCLENSQPVVDEAYARSWQEVRIAGPGEDGIQADNSFHQHGPLLYNYGYGSDFASDVTRLVAMARGTDIKIPTEQQALFNSYLLDGTLWMVRGGKLDWGACGRGICRVNRLAGGFGGGIGAYQIMAGSAGPRQSDMTNAMERLKTGDDTSAPVGNRQFWLSDFMVQRRANYYVSVRMYSDRTLDTDGLINGENRKSHHLSDGATCLMVTGNEYFNIFPVWDWHRIPGTTVQQGTPLEEKQSAISHKGKTSFVGSVSDGTYGCSAMDLETGKLHASKAWFCFEDQIVCLGAGIDCPDAKAVNTNLNQCLLHGPVQTADGEIEGDRDLHNTTWAWHDSIGYVWRKQTAVHFKNQTQTGRWSDIGTGPEAPVTADVFSLWIDHGQSPKNSEYAYTLLPGSTAKQTAEQAANPQTTLISNTPALQAVWHDNLKMLQAVFRSPGEVSAGAWKISVDQPCILMLQQFAGKLRLSVANPRHQAGTVNVSINGHPTGVDLPTGLAGGSSVVQEIP